MTRTTHPATQRPPRRNSHAPACYLGTMSIDARYLKGRGK